MEMLRKFFPAIVVILLVVVATGVSPVRAERECETVSLRFEGPCMVESNCANVCRTEGFVGGRCSTFARRCICIKPC
ncbi:defensin Ec-AMP-D1-like [Oryza brachyantha]|uniref:Knottins-like domain-containing protein n=1 Tax=Oryza brachyantha TaxID=4533 RepID=J3LVW1_ORYBR|nr:defensin Ec-AMP-D1-like [Oryza brachyantha]